jgi:uncharacterized membrane protein YhaH (DUF805 family)
MTDTYNVTLTGATLPDRPRELAAKALAAVMRITPEQALNLLSGRKTIVKRNVDADQVPRYLQAIEGAGVEVRAERVAPPPKLPEAPAPLALTPIDADTIKCPSCGASQPKRNLCRECGADMSRLLAAQEEAKRNPPEQSPFAPPTAMVRDIAASASEAETPRPFAMSFQGRVGRVRYLAYCLPAYVPMLIGALVGGFFFGVAHSKAAFAIFFGLGSLATMVLAIRVVVLRLHDINRSGWWILAPVPIGVVAAISSAVGLVLVALFVCLGSLALLFWPGSAEDNDFGPPAGENTVWTTIGAVVMILLSATGNTMSSMAKFGDKAPAGAVSEQRVP